MELSPGAFVRRRVSPMSLNVQKIFSAVVIAFVLVAPAVILA